MSHSQALTSKDLSRIRGILQTAIIIIINTKTFKDQDVCKALMFSSWSQRSQTVLIPLFKMRRATFFSSMINSILKKIELWERNMGTGSVDIFPSLKQFIPSHDMQITGDVTIVSCITLLPWSHSEWELLSWSGYDRIRALFTVEIKADILNIIKEEMMHVLLPLENPIPNNISPWILNQCAN